MLEGQSCISRGRHHTEKMSYPSSVVIILHNYTQAFIPKGFKMMPVGLSHEKLPLCLDDDTIQCDLTLGVTHFRDSCKRVCEVCMSINPLCLSSFCVPSLREPNDNEALISVSLDHPNRREMKNMFRKKTKWLRLQSITSVCNV